MLGPPDAAGVDVLDWFGCPAPPTAAAFDDVKPHTRIFVFNSRMPFFRCAFEVPIVTAVLPVLGHSSWQFVLFAPVIYIRIFQCGAGFYTTHREVCSRP